MGSGEYQKIRILIYSVLYINVIVLLMRSIKFGLN